MTKSSHQRTRRILMVFSALCYLLFHPGVTQAIIGGAPDAVSRNGVVKIQSQRWSCTGTLISRTLVLTAAHCVWDPQSQSYFYDLTSAVVGTEDGIAGRSSGISKVIGAVRHPGYNGTDGRNDIALIQVQDVFDGNFIELATAEETAASEQAFSIGIASGFGVTQQGGSSSSTLLQVNQQILSSTYCRSSWNYKITYADTFLCALGAPTSTVCSGDSGGPLFLNIGGRRKLAGVTNFGTQSCGAGVSVFARVSSFQSFLVENGFAALARTTPALPALPPPSVIQSLPQLPSRPVFQTDPSKQVTLPKFSVSRIFQLILQGSTKCSIYIDGPIALRGSQIRVYVGNKSRSPIKRIVLDEFGDVFIATKMNCLSIRGLGVFILQPNSTVKVRTEE